MVALVIVLACCFSSDLLNERPKHIMAMGAMSTIALIITAAVTNSKARYAFLAIGMLTKPATRVAPARDTDWRTGASGIWACSPLTLSYLSNTICRPAEKRAVAIGVVKCVNHGSL